MENSVPSQEAINAVQQLLLLSAVRALMESHPDPASFRESWAHCMSLTFRDLLAGPPEHREDTNRALQKLLPVWESFFPDSDAAKTKPKPGDTPRP